jgi:acyl-CoA dehydrogenase
MNFDHSKLSFDLQKRIQNYFITHILPRNREWYDYMARAESSEPPFLKQLRQQARSEGLWNLALPNLADDEPGTRLSNLEFAPIAEIMGRIPWASQLFNCHAPDVPNMEILQLFGTEDQKERWLRPLLEGEIRSAFAMTEPNVASSDATNINTRIEKHKDHYLINGHKWFAAGAGHPDCKFIVVMGVSNPEGTRTKRHSMVIVPIDAPGIDIIRNVKVFNHIDMGTPNTELKLKNVKVSLQNLIGQEGSGFKIAQARLGPARIHHCMRSIGQCEVLIELMMARAQERVAFGKPIIDYDTTQRRIAESRLEIELARLLVYKTAWLLDSQGSRAARREISLIKVAVARAFHKIADRAVQLFGAMGVTEDTPIANAFSWSRAFRIYDGPDEVHLRVIFKLEQKPSYSLGDSPYLYRQQSNEQD